MFPIVLVVESTAQVFYQSLKDATACPLLRQICTEILIDEAYHITFQTERMIVLFNSRKTLPKGLIRAIYKSFFFAVSILVWFVNRRLFRAGGNTFRSYCRKMHYKYCKTLHRAMHAHIHSDNFQPAMG